MKTVFSNKCVDPCPSVSCGANSVCSVVQHEAVCRCQEGYEVELETKVHPHSDPRALVLCDLILSTSANPANTGRAAVLYTAQLLCLRWLDWQT